MKVLLISPYVNQNFDRPAESIIREDFIPSAALLYLAAILRANNYEPIIVDLNNSDVHNQKEKYFDYCKKIVKAFKIHGACDFDIVIRKDLKPQLLDSSCRLSGSVGASLNAGVNVTAELIKMLHGKKINKFKIGKNIKVFPIPIFVKSS